MPEIMPFGRMVGKSVEQICVNDYKYFTWLYDDADIWKPSLMRRFDFVETVANNFKSVLLCNGPGCTETPRYMSIYFNPFMGVKTGSTGHIYCSEECYRNDNKASSEKTSLQPLKFRTAISSTKFDTNHLIKKMLKCMGAKEDRRLTKEYLEDLFDNAECW